MKKWDLPSCPDDVVFNLKGKTLGLGALDNANSVEIFNAINDLKIFDVKILSEVSSQWEKWAFNQDMECSDPDIILHDKAFDGITKNYPSSVVLDWFNFCELLETGTYGFLDPYENNTHKNPNWKNYGRIDLSFIDKIPTMPKTEASIKYPYRQLWGNLLKEIPRGGNIHSDYHFLLSELVDPDKRRIEKKEFGKVDYLNAPMFNPGRRLAAFVDRDISRIYDIYEHLALVGDRVELIEHEYYSEILDWQNKADTLWSNICECNDLYVRLSQLELMNVLLDSSIVSKIYGIKRPLLVKNVSVERVDEVIENSIQRVTRSIESAVYYSSENLERLMKFNLLLASLMVGLILLLIFEIV